MSRLGNVLSGLAQYSSCRGTRIGGIKISLRLSHGRSLALTSQRWEKSTKPEEEEDISRPIKFSTSRASHKNWNVDQSLGSKYQRPLWKVLPISVFGMAFLLWCAFRGETAVDEQLEKQLYEHLPGLLSDEQEERVQEEQGQEKSS